MISTRTKDKLQRTIDERENFYVNRSKNFSIYEEKTLNESELSGITLLALVVTIIVNRVFYDKNRKYRNLVGSPMIYINL